MVNLHLLIILLLFAGTTLAEKKRYDGDYVLRVVPHNSDELQVLQNLQRRFDFWRLPTTVGVAADVQLSAKDDQTLHILQTMEHHMLIEDVQRVLDEQEKHGKAKAGKDLDYGNYYDLTGIYTWLDEMVVECGSDCEIINIGTSAEGRDLRLIKISRPGIGRSIAWIDGGTHAREWIAPAVAMYSIERLIRDYGVDPDVTTLRDEYDFYIEPVVNVDGYEYSWTNDRLWSKTRGTNVGSSCLGSDANKNFDYGWEDASSGTNPCDDAYKGDTPFSEQCTMAISDFILPDNNRYHYFLTMHSYGQEFRYACGCLTVQPPDEIDELELICQNAAATATAVNGVTYTCRQQVLSCGSAPDWAYGAAGVKYSFLVELRDTGESGYFLPPDQIYDQDTEAWAAIKGMLLEIMGRP